VARFARYVDAAFVGVDNRFADRQAKAASAFGLCCP
jgi:hypothetical protein